MQLIWQSATLPRWRQRVRASSSAPYMVPQPSGKATVCKTVIPQFKSGWYLHDEVSLQNLSPKTLVKSRVFGFFMPKKSTISQQSQNGLFLRPLGFEPVQCANLIKILYISPILKKFNFNKTGLFLTALSVKLVSFCLLPQNLYNENE